MNLTFYGAAGEVTGSAHVFGINGHKILLDCGLYQGKRKEAFEKNRQFLYDPQSLDAAILSHAHMDHSGNMPTLVKAGFEGLIYCTPATRDLCEIMFRDCAYLQMRDVEYVNKKRIKQGKTPFEPLYTEQEADHAVTRLQPLPYNKAAEILPGVSVTIVDAGHILGSGFVVIDYKENGSSGRLLFTGDIGRRDIPILKDPVVIKDIDYLITESTYGDRKHPAREELKDELAGFVNDIHAKKSKLIIPAFSIGRTQLIVYLLNQLFSENRIPAVPTYVDSPLSSAATKIYSKHQECWDKGAIDFLLHEGKPFNFKSLRYTESVEESKSLNGMPGPMIIISASGMAEGGRIVHHIKNNITDPESIILIVGYQAENTLGRRVAEKQPEIKIFGEYRPLNARVEELAALSAHADKYEMLELYNACGPANIKHAFCVHGEDNALAHFSECLLEAGVQNVSIPKPGDSFELEP